MAIDYATLTSIVDTLKNVYGDMTEQFDGEPITYNQFPKSKDSCGGNGYVGAIEYERPQGAGSRAEQQYLPDPLVGKFDQYTITPKSLYGRIRLTGQAIDLAKGGVESFVNSLTSSVNGIYNSVLDMANVQSHGDGFGLIATLSAASDTLTTSSTTWTITCDNDAGLMYAREGQLVDFFNSDSFDESAVASRISTIDETNKTAEMEYNDSTYKTHHPITAAQSYTVVAATVASGSYMIRMGTRTDTHVTTNTPVEMTGLDGIFDDSTLLATFEGITVSTHPKWKANILGNSSVKRPLTEDLMLQAVDLCRRRSKEKKIVIRMGGGQQRKFFALFAADRRFTPGELIGGYETLSFSVGGACEILIDPMTQPNKIYFEPKNTIKKFEAVPLGWSTMSGMWNNVANYDEMDAYLRLRSNLGCKQRNILTVVKDLIEPNIFS